MTVETEINLNAKEVFIKSQKFYLAQNTSRGQIEQYSNIYSMIDNILGVIQCHGLEEDEKELVDALETRHKTMKKQQEELAYQFHLNMKTPWVLHYNPDVEKVHELKIKLNEQIKN